MATTTTNSSVQLNFRGKARQFGVRTLNTMMTSGKQSIIIIAATIVLYLLFAIISPALFQPTNINELILQFAPYAILGLGVTFVIATGGIDLSIGTVCLGSVYMAGSLCHVAYGSFELVGLALILTIVFGFLFGLLNGYLIAKVKLPPFIATLGTMMISRGLPVVVGYFAGQDVATLNFPSANHWKYQVFGVVGGFPIALVWVLAFMAICMVVMYKTKLGRYILAIGSNEEAARLSGINVDFYKIVAYCIAGTFAGIAAIFYLNTQSGISPASGNGMELDAIAGVYIGGTSAAGGVASIVGTIFGALILKVINLGLTVVLGLAGDLTTISTYITYIFTGVIVVFAVIMDVVKAKAASKVKLAESADKCKAKYKEEKEALRVKNDYILSDKSLSQEDRKAQSEAVKAELAQLKETFTKEYAECKAADAKVMAEAKATRQAEKQALKAQKTEEKANKQ